MLKFFNKGKFKLFVAYFPKDTVAMWVILFFILSLFSADNFGQGNAMNFNGRNSHISLSLNGFSNGTNHPTFTVQAWVRMIKKQSTTIFSSTSFGLQLKNDSICASVEGYYGIYTLSSFFDYLPSQWYHISFTLVNGAVCYLYVDGILVGTKTMSAIGAALARYNTLWIGYNDDNKDGYFSGDIDEVKIWSSDRTQKISSDILEGKDPFGTDLFSYLKFDEGLASGDNRSIGQLKDIVQDPANDPPLLTGFEKIGDAGNWVKSYAMLSPIGLAASNVEPTSFIANWLDPTSLTPHNYLVDVTDGLDNFLTINPTKNGYVTLPAIDTFLQISNLRPNTNYHYRVRAVWGSGDKKVISAYSETIDTTTFR